MVLESKLFFARQRKSNSAILDISAKPISDIINNLEIVIQIVFRYIPENKTLISYKEN